MLRSDPKRLLPKRLLVFYFDLPPGGVVITKSAKSKLSKNAEYTTKTLKVRFWYQIRVLRPIECMITIIIYYFI